jgi:hypothetical protein
MSNVAVTRSACDTRLHVRFVCEAGVIRQPMDSLPDDGFLLSPGQADFLDLRLTLTHTNVAGHALLHVWQTSGYASARGAVTECAVKSRDLGVNTVVEGNRLRGRRRWLRRNQPWRRDRKEKYSTREHRCWQKHEW